MDRAISNTIETTVHFASFDDMYPAAKHSATSSQLVT